MILHFRNRQYVPEKIPLIMGILNVTPDSFSDGGSGKPLADRIHSLAVEGAGIIDVGGESTRPGAEEIPVEEELSRVIPAVRMIRELYPEMIISVDTRKSETACKALENGADIINDVSGLNFDPEMAQVIAGFQAGAILMHMRALPQNMQNNENLEYQNGLIETVKNELMQSIRKAESAGIPHENIILDPGIGFAKNAVQSAELIRCAETLHELGMPLLSGPSRKSFIGTFTGESDPKARDYGTCGAVIASFLAGYSIVRVHNVKAAADALNVFRACYGKIIRHH